MATVSFYAGDDNNITNLAGSGLGFYGAGFGYSVSVGAWQDTTWITNANGTSQGPQANNVKYANQGSGYVDSSTTPTGLRFIPNQQATLNIRFTHGSNVNVQNAQVRLFDRYDINNAPSGVSTALCQTIHPGTSQSGPQGSGSTVWTIVSGDRVAGSGISLGLAPNPGISGLYAGNGSNSVVSSNQHDWYICVSSSPDSTGSKTQYGLRFSVDYL